MSKPNPLTDLLKIINSDKSNYTKRQESELSNGSIFGSTTGYTEIESTFPKMQLKPMER
jgi:hypothetical protein